MHIKWAITAILLLGTACAVTVPPVVQTTASPEAQTASTPSPYPTPMPTPTPSPDELAKASRLAAIPSIPFTTVIYNKFGWSFPADQRIVRRSDQARLRTRDGRDATLPALDYENQIGLLAAFGDQMTGMIDGEIYAIEDQGHRLLVHSVLWVPAPYLGMTADIGNPLHYVSIAHTDKPIEFAPPVTIEWYTRTSRGPSPIPLLYPVPEPTPTLRPDPALASLLARPSLSFIEAQNASLTAMPGLEAAKAVFQSREEILAFFATQPEPTRNRLAQLDMTGRTAILVAAGPQPTDTFDLQIVSVEDQGTELVVNSVLWAPASGPVRPGAVGHPYHLITVAKTDKPIRFTPTLAADLRLRPSPAGRS